ncbi:MAG: NFACT family protein [Ruminococcus sp.]|nr:NFACT family protein [Ruminococcus sp.]
MALDGIYLSLIKKELSCLIDGRVDKIYQPSREELLITVRGREGAKKLLINTGAGSARAHITSAEIDNPKTPPMFCMLMRKRLSGARITDIRQDGFERILYIDMEGIDEMGDRCELTLAAELMGRRSNLILYTRPDEKIIDSIKRIGQETANRMVLPGMIYERPSREDRLDILSCEREAFFERLSACEGKRLSKAIMVSCEGISPVFADEIEALASGGDEVTAGELSDDASERIWAYITKIREQVQAGENRYTVLTDGEGRLRDFCFCDIEHFGSLMERTYFTSAGELLDSFYSGRDTLSRTKQRAGDLFRHLSTLIDRTRRRVKNQRLELDDCADRDKFRVMGDLIMANLYAIEKGSGSVKLANFYEEGSPEVEIKLDKRLSPNQNAQKYYKEYKKLDTAQKMLTGLIEEGENETAYLESVYDALTRAKTEGELDEIRAELREQGYLRRGRQKGKPAKAAPPLRFISSDGYEIRVGRNNKQNDMLTCKQSEKNDLWLHTKEITGSHVIVSCSELGGEFPPDRTVEEAAIIAACHSSAAESSRCDVDYTFIKNVKKPNGAKPGMVIFVNNYTITVKPDRELAERLRADK